MVKYRQPIRPGQSGGDVLAVKRAMKKMKIHGAGSMNLSGHQGRTAGKAFTASLNRVLESHGYKGDGIYGPKAHGIIAPHFDRWGAALYRTAKVRPSPVHPPLHLGAQKAAQRLLELSHQGRYHPDNPGDLADIENTAKGHPVWSAALGSWVRIDHRVFEILLWLIETKGYKIGTYAICSDHHSYDGPHGHNGGYAVDISSINDSSLSSGGAFPRNLGRQVAKLVHNAPGELQPRQQICDGVGNAYDAEIAAQCRPYRNFYSYSTLVAHRNHIHIGY